MTATLIARPFLRVSYDNSGRERSNEEQLADHRRAADRYYWTLGVPYHGVGPASRYARKKRKEFADLIADLEADRFGAQILMLWECSRGSRQVGEWSTLIDLCEKRGVKIYVTTHDRLYDMANPRDRRTMQEEAVDAEYESGKTSQRVLRDVAAAAAAGRPHGRVPYGYSRRYDPRTGELAEQTPEPTEAAIVRELYARLRKGESLRSIAKDLDRRGVRTRIGAVWSEQLIRPLVLRRVYIAQRTHHGQITDGQWEPLIDRKSWQAVHDRLTAPDRMTARPGRAKHLLSMIAVCDVCSGPLSARPARDGRVAAYQCHRNSHIRVGYDDLDDLAEAAMLAYLSRPDNVERLTANPDGNAQLEAVREEIAAITGEQVDLADQVGRGALSATLAARAEPQIQARLDAARAREAELTTPSVLRDLVEPGADVARRWAAAPMSAKREVARLLLAPDVLGELRLARSSSPGHRVDIEERVVWRRA